MSVNKFKNCHGMNLNIDSLTGSIGNKNGSLRQELKELQKDIFVNQKDWH